MGYVHLDSGFNKHYYLAFDFRYAYCIQDASNTPFTRWSWQLDEPACRTSTSYCV